MKTIFKLTIPVILLTSLASCTRQMPYTAEAEAMTLTVYAPETKTVNNGLKTEWSASDALSVLSERPGGFNNEKFTNDGSNQFVGNMPKPAPKVLYVVYPYDNKYQTPKSLTFDVASSVTQSGNGSMAHLAGPSFPLYGNVDYSESPVLQVNQLLAVGEFNITNGTDAPIVVKSIEFSAPGAIAGNVTVDITGKSVAYTPASGDKSSKSVSVKVIGGSAIASEKSASFYAGMIPFSTTGDFSISVTADYGGKEVVSSKDINSKAIALEAGCISALNYTFTVTELPNEGITETDLGTFNLVNVDMDSFMAEAEKVYTNDNWHVAGSTRAEGLTIVANYNNGDNGDLADDPEKVTAYSFDRPNPVVIPVEGHEDESVTVTMSLDGDYSGESFTMSAMVDNDKIEIYNLIPGFTYHYSVANSAGEICKGFFNTVGRRRIMKVSDVVSAARANNLRDFGGLKTVDGKKIRYGKIFRGTNMDDLTTDEKNYMTDVMCIGLDVDLRRPDEENIRNRAKRILDEEKVAYSNAGFISFDDLITPGKVKPTMLAILETLQAGKAVYIHCFAGADRTGCLSMALEALCGVSEKDCTIDYELTSFSCIGPRPRIAYNSGFMGYFHPYLVSLQGDTFKAKAERFFLDCGLTSEQIATLQSLLVE